MRVAVRHEDTRVVLHVQDGGREEGDETEVEQALAAAARNPAPSSTFEGRSCGSLSVPAGAGLNSHDRGSESP